MLHIKNCEHLSIKEIGTISISIYKDTKTGLSAFNINSDEDVVYFSYAIEDTMKMF